MPSIKVFGWFGWILLLLYFVITNFTVTAILLSASIWLMLTAVGLWVIEEMEKPCDDRYC